MDRKFSLAHANDLDLGFALINVTDRSYLLRDGSGIGVVAPQYGPRRGLYMIADLAF